eukprot:Skav203616  [mRNA]  locus=scaffold935:584866:599914:+ [translate_table: standard]
MDLHLFVLAPVVAEFLGIAQLLPAVSGQLHSFFQLFSAVFQQGVSVVVQDRQPLCRQTPRVLRGQSAPEPHILQDQIGIPVLLASIDPIGVVPHVQHAIFRPVEVIRILIRSTKQGSFPGVSHRKVQQTHRRFGFELVPVVRVLRQEFTDHR